MITKRANIQFATILAGARDQALCVTECFNIASGKREYVLCVHQLVDGAIEYQPLAKLFQGNPYNEVTPPGAAQYKLI